MKPSDKRVVPLVGPMAAKRGGKKVDRAVLKRTDYGNAERMVARHGCDLRYCHPWSKWLVWDERRWRIDDTAEVVRRAKLTVRATYKEAWKLGTTDDRKALASWAVRSESTDRLRGMITLAQSEAGIPVLPDELDVDPWLLNVENGVVDLRTGDLHPHRREHLITKLAPVPYDPTAPAPTWETFIGRIFDCDAELIGFVQRFVGYSLTGDTSEQCFAYCYGTGANGKSTLLTVLREVLGDYAQTTPIETLLHQSRGSGIPNDLARLKGARLVTATEADEGRRLAESLIKALTGGDSIAARFLRAEFFEFTPSFKLWLAANHKLTIRGTGHAMWRRLRLIPFNVTIPAGERDLHLVDKLRAELPGILAWAVRGCLEWQRDGLKEPATVTAATDEYREQMDVLGAFITECCIEGPELKASVKEFRRAYEEWCSANGERPLSQKVLAPRLEERGFESERKSNGVWWSGLMVK